MRRRRQAADAAAAEAEARRQEEQARAGELAGSMRVRQPRPLGGGPAAEAQARADEQAALTAGDAARQQEAEARRAEAAAQAGERLARAAEAAASPPRRQPAPPRAAAAAEAAARADGSGRGRRPPRLPSNSGRRPRLQRWRPRSPRPRRHSPTRPSTRCWPSRATAPSRRVMRATQPQGLRARRHRRQLQCRAAGVRPRSARPARADDRRGLAAPGPGSPAPRMESVTRSTSRSAATAVRSPRCVTTAPLVSGIRRHPTGSNCPSPMGSGSPSAMTAPPSPSSRPDRSR